MQKVYAFRLFQVCQVNQDTVASISIREAYEPEARRILDQMTQHFLPAGSSRLSKVYSTD